MKKSHGCWRESRPPIVLTARDYEQLRTLLSAASTPDPNAARFLREECDRAEIVSTDVPSTSLVTMGSAVKFVDHGTGRIRRVLLVNPDQADKKGCISVLSTTGSALIGLGPGQSISWTEQETERSLTVLEVYARCPEGSKGSAI